jgi:hypothetical protein
MLGGYSCVNCTSFVWRVGSRWRRRTPAGVRRADAQGRSHVFTRAGGKQQTNRIRMRCKVIEWWYCAGDGGAKAPDDTKGSKLGDDVPWTW